ncbi:MAG: hypothetical protein J1F02_03720 [Lachnospiraceae bacterium]|nr:hypothetical protein [Lachnospiraceae bacterium]
MKKSKCRFFIVRTAVILWLAAMLSTGCGHGGEEAPLQTAVPTQKSTMKTLTIYSIDSDNMTLIPVSVKKEEQKITAWYIASLVLENLNKDDIEVTVVEKKKKKVYVSFSTHGKPVQNCNKEMETLILDCFSNSILDNVKGCDQVIFRCDGNKEYRSSQYSFGLEEAYASK